MRQAALAAAVAGLLACGEDHHPPLVVAARSGAAVDLTRTAWQACREDLPYPGVSELWREEHGPEGGVVYTVAFYPVPGCAGGAQSASETGTVTTAAGQRSVAFAGVPPAGLGPSVAATEVSVDGGVHGIGHDCYWVDDTVSPRVLYTGDPAASADAQGYPDAFFAGGEQEIPYPAPRLTFAP